MRDGITLDGIILVVQSEDNIYEMLKIIVQGICGEEIFPDE